MKKIAIVYTSISIVYHSPTGNNPTAAPPRKYYILSFIARIMDTNAISVIALHCRNSPHFVQWQSRSFLYWPKASFKAKPFIHWQNGYLKKKKFRTISAKNQRMFIICQRNLIYETILLWSNYYYQISLIFGIYCR